jgi:predicted transcriptional regulator
MLTKQKIIKSIENMPDKFSIDEVIERIVLLQKIEIGLEQSDKGETHSTQEARKKLDKWLK